MTNINVTNARVFIPEIWSKDVVTATQANLVMAKLVSNRSAEAKTWDTINVPVVWGLVANDKVSNTEVTIQSGSNSLVPVLINKHKEVSFIVEDIAGIQSATDLRAVFTESAGMAIANAIDADLVALYSGLSQHVGTFGTDINEDTVLAAKLKLDLANAPRTGRSLVIRPEQENALLKVDRFTKVAEFGPNQAIREGQIGRIHGFDVYPTTQVVKDGVGATDSHNLAFHSSAFAVAMQLEPRAQALYSQKDLGWLVTIDTIYWVAEIKDSFAVEVKS